MRHIFCFLSQRILILSKSLKEEGPNVMSLALIKGLACPSRSNMTKDMTSNLKKTYRQKMQKIAKFDILWKITFSGF